MLGVEFFGRVIVIPSGRDLKVAAQQLKPLGLWTFFMLLGPSSGIALAWDVRGGGDMTSI